MRFEFATATKIIFGAGTLCEAGAIAKEFGNRALVVTGRDPKRAGSLLKILRETGVGAAAFSVAGEPELSAIEQGTAFAKKEKCDFVIGFGGGSAIDAGKAIAAMLTNDGRIARLPRNHRARQGVDETVRAIHRHSDDSGHRLGSHAQRGAVIAGTQSESQPAQSV